MTGASGASDPVVSDWKGLANGKVSWELQVIPPRVFRGGVASMCVLFLVALRPGSRGICCSPFKAVRQLVLKS